MLDLGGTSTSGTLPSQLAQLTELTFLNLGTTSTSGILPSQLAQLTKLTELALDHTSITGTLPFQLPKLTKLTYLYLEHTSISGTLPQQLGNTLHAADTLNFGSMQLSGTVPASLLRTCQPFDKSGAACDGIPPVSCSAFGERSRLSIHSLTECVSCPASTAATAVKVTLVGVLLSLGAIAYVAAVDRFPHYREWIATTSLILSHMQVVGLLGSLAALSHADVQLGCGRCSSSRRTWAQSARSASCRRSHRCSWKTRLAQTPTQMVRQALSPPPRPSSRCTPSSSAPASSAR